MSLKSENYLRARLESAKTKLVVSMFWLSRKTQNKVCPIGKLQTQKFDLVFNVACNLTMLLGCSIAATLTDDFEVIFEDDQIRAKQEAQGLVSECQEKARIMLENANGDSTLTMSAMDELVGCVETGVSRRLSMANEEIAFQANIRTEMAKQMENYTCTDLSLDSTAALREETWRGAKDRVRRKVNVMLDRPASKIHVIENFIDQEECEAMEAAAKPKLHLSLIHI